MKLTFTLFTFLFSLAAMAGFDNTKLTISSSSGASIRVMVDGNRYSRTGGAVIIRNIPAGYHTIKVFQKKQSRFGNGYSSNYQQVYSAQVNIKNQYHTDIMLNRFGKALVDEQVMGSGYYDEDDDDWGNDGNYGGWNNGNNGGWNTGNGNWNGMTMDARTFDQFKQVLRNETMDDSRLNLAKQTISANNFTSAQVKELVNLFTFESNKVDLAKYAYRYTVDKGSYFVLNDAFTFSSSKEELSNYIRNFRQ